IIGYRISLEDRLTIWYNRSTQWRRETLRDVAAGNKYSAKPRIARSRRAESEMTVPVSTQLERYDRANRERRRNAAADSRRGGGSLSQTGRRVDEPGPDHRGLGNRQGPVLSLLQEQGRPRSRGAPVVPRRDSRRRGAAQLRHRIVGRPRSMVHRAARFAKALSHDAWMPLRHDRQRGDGERRADPAGSQSDLGGGEDEAGEVLLEREIGGPAQSACSGGPTRRLLPGDDSGRDADGKSQTQQPSGRKRRARGDGASSNVRPDSNVMPNDRAPTRPSHARSARGSTR